jgi:hypothetical protein
LLHSLFRSSSPCRLSPFSHPFFGLFLERFDDLFHEVGVERLAFSEGHGGLAGGEVSAMEVLGPDEVNGLPAVPFELLGLGGDPGQIARLGPVAAVEHAALEQPNWITPVRTGGRPR